MLFLLVDLWGDRKKKRECFSSLPFFLPYIIFGLSRLWSFFILRTSLKLLQSQRGSFCFYFTHFDEEAVAFWLLLFCPFSGLITTPTPILLWPTCPNYSFLRLVLLSSNVYRRGDWGSEWVTCPKLHSWYVAELLVCQSPEPSAQLHILWSSSDLTP